LHKLTNERDRHYKRREKTVYVTATHAEEILLGQGDLQSDLLPAEVFAAGGDTKASKYYLPYRQPYVGSSLLAAQTGGRGHAWMFLVIDFSTGQITFHRPKLVKDPPPAADLPPEAVKTAAAKALSDEAEQDKQVFTRLLATLDAKRASVGDVNCPTYVEQRAAGNVVSCWTFDPVHSRPKATSWVAGATAESSPTWCRCSHLKDFGIAVLISMEFEYSRLSPAWDASDIYSVVRPNFAFWLLKSELPMH
jgi:hypothetical protein